MKGKIYKSVTALLSTAAMLLTYADFSAIDFTVHADSGDEPKLTDFDVNGNGKIEDEEKEWGYELDSADDLYWFADKVNNDNANYGSANAFLACDITVNSDVLNENGGLNEGDFREWTPIGAYNEIKEEYYYYSGIFDGNSKTISGLYFNNSDVECVSLFGQTESSGTIKNVTVSDSYMNGSYNVGGVCGYNNGTISNCYNTGTVTGDDSVGGVCGGNNGTIKNCYNTGDVTGTDDYVGGVCGDNYSDTITDCYNIGTVTGNYFVGGVCGYNYVTISNCYNTGTVTGNDYVGSVCGDNYGTISNCYNTGDVTATGEEAFVGGVCGFNREKTIITNCYNTGKVTATGDPAYVGGVCGYNEEGIITNCYNTGDVTATGEEAFVGGVSGFNREETTITNCYYLDTIAENGIGDVDDETGSAEAKSAEQFASGEVCWLLSGEQSESPVFYQNLGTDESPVPDSTHHAVKYSETSYYNEHTDFDENGFCTICDGYEPAKAVADVTNMDGDGNTEENVYEISNAGQLYWFAGLVNGTLEGVKQIRYANAYLTNDITVNSGVLDENGELNEGDFRVWTPIGKNRTGAYTGTFDGNNKTISGLYFNDSSANIVGLFGYVGIGSSENKVMNITVADSYFCGNENVGGVCGYSYIVTIQNCSNTGTVRGDSYVGGVCGYINKRVIENCYNTGKVSGNSYIGGICGYNCEKNTIQNCYNTGAVSGNTIVGGICGKDNYTGSGSIMIKNCYNKGAVSGNTYVGSINGSGESKLIQNCYYLGTEGVSGRGGGPDSEGSTTAMSETKFKSGEVCWLLNGGETQAETPAFFQTIGTDEIPVLDSTHGRVYLTTNCVTYSNTDGNKNHAPDSCAKEATCTEDGCEAYWYCKDCGMYFSDADCTNEIEDIETWKSENAIPATGHSYKDGICEKCGAFKDGIGARLSGVSLSLDGSIGVNFYMQLAEEVLEDETAYMLFTLPNGETSEIKVSKAETKTVGGVTYYGFKCNVAATEMTDTIKAQIITVNGNGTAYSYTVKEYADYLLAHTEGNAEYAKAEELVKAMLNYGAYAQKFKEHNTDNLPCEPMDMTTYNIKAHSFTAAPSDNVEFKGANLSMLSNTTLRLFFEIDDETGVTMSYGSEKLETGKNNGLYFAEIKNIAPLILDNDFTVLTSDGSMVTYSPLTYCYQVSQESNDAALVELVKAIALYNEAAKAYFKEAK